MAACAGDRLAFLAEMFRRKERLTVFGIKALEALRDSIYCVTSGLAAERDAAQSRVSRRFLMGISLSLDSHMVVR